MNPSSSSHAYNGTEKVCVATHRTGPSLLTMMPVRVVKGLDEALLATLGYRQESKPAFESLEVSRVHDIYIYIYARTSIKGVSTRCSE